MNKITSLDGLRGLAAILVLIDHSLLATFDLFHHPYGVLFYILSFIGSFSVGVFFILSGFVIFASISKENSASFLMKRAFRIYPVIITATAINYIIQIRYGIAVIDIPTIKNFILNISLFGGAFRYNESLILQIVWTLSIEVQFYLLAALILSLTRRNVDKYIFPVVLILMFAFIAVSIHVLSMSDSPFKVYIGVGSSIVPFMFIGTSICMLNKKVISKSQFTILVFFIILAISYAPYSVYFSLEKGLPSYLLAIGVFCLCLYYKPISEIMSNKVMLFLGKISYPLYAIHMSAIDFVHSSQEFGGNTGSFLRMFIFSIAMAYILHIFIESPVHLWSKKKLKRKNVVIQPS